MILNTEITRGHSWSLMVTRRHSWSLVCTFRQDPGWWPACSPLVNIGICKTLTKAFCHFKEEYKYFKI